MFRRLSASFIHTSSTSPTDSTSRRQEKEDSELKTCTQSNSIRSLQSCGTCMHSTSIQVLYQSESVTSPSAEDLELSTRVSQCQTGQKQKTQTVGNLIITHKRLGTTVCMTCTLRPHQCNSLVTARSQILFSGSVWNNSEREAVPVSSTTKYHNLPGSDSVDICLRTRTASAKETACYTHSLMQTRINRLTLALTLLPQKVLKSSRENSTLCVS